jgi:hypothetical protein
LGQFPLLTERTRLERKKEKHTLWFSWSIITLCGFTSRCIMPLL